MTRRQRSDDLTTFGAPVDPRAVPGKDDAARAKRANAPLVTDRLDYQADGAGLLGPVRKHLHVLDLASGQVRQVTTGDWHASDPVWSPGSALLAFGAATAPDADLNLSAPVYVVDVSGAAGETAEPELAALASGFGAPVAWAPDGTALLVVGATGEKGLIGHTRLLRVPLPAALRAISRRSDPAKPDTEATLSGPKTEGALLDLAGALDRNVMPGGPGYPGGMPQFTDGGDTVLFCARDRAAATCPRCPRTEAPRPGRSSRERAASCPGCRWRAGPPPSSSRRPRASERSSPLTSRAGLRVYSPRTGPSTGRAPQMGAPRATLTSSCGRSGNSLSPTGP